MKQKITHGYIALMTVLALMVFSLSLLLVAPYLSIGNTQQALGLFQSERVWSALEGCAEETLLALARDENFAPETRYYFGVRCEVSMVRNGAVYELSLVGTREEITRRLEVSAERILGVPGRIAPVRWLER